MHAKKATDKAYSDADNRWGQPHDSAHGGNCEGDEKSHDDIYGGDCEADDKSHDRANAPMEEKVSIAKVTNTRA